MKDEERGPTLVFAIPKEYAIEPNLNCQWVDIPENLTTYYQVKDFDRDTCAKGIKRFLRKVTQAELDTFPEIAEDCVLVCEITPGTRTKLHCFRHQFSNQ